MEKKKNQSVMNKRTKGRRQKRKPQFEKKKKGIKNYKLYYTQNEKIPKSTIDEYSELLENIYSPSGSIENNSTSIYMMDYFLNEYISNDNDNDFFVQLSNLQGRKIDSENLVFELNQFNDYKNMENQEVSIYNIKAGGSVGIVKCKVCGGLNTMLYGRQTRSADEEETQFLRCNPCNTTRRLN